VTDELCKSYINQYSFELLLKARCHRFVDRGGGGMQTKTRGQEPQKHFVSGVTVYVRVKTGSGLMVMVRWRLFRVPVGEGVGGCL